MTSPPSHGISRASARATRRATNANKPRTLTRCCVQEESPVLAGLLTTHPKPAVRAPMLTWMLLAPVPGTCETTSGEAVSPAGRRNLRMARKEGGSPSCAKGEDEGEVSADLDVRRIGGQGCGLPVQENHGRDLRDPGRHDREPAWTARGQGESEQQRARQHGHARTGEHQQRGDHQREPDRPDPAAAQRLKEGERDTGEARDPENGQRSGPGELRVLRNRPHPCPGGDSPQEAREKAEPGRRKQEASPRGAGPRGAGPRRGRRRGRGAGVEAGAHGSSFSVYPGGRAPRRCRVTHAPAQEFDGPPVTRSRAVDRLYGDGHLATGRGRAALAVLVKRQRRLAGAPLRGRGGEPGAAGAVLRRRQGRG